MIAFHRETGDYTVQLTAHSDTASESDFAPLDRPLPCSKDVLAQSSATIYSIEEDLRWPTYEISLPTNLPNDWPRATVRNCGNVLTSPSFTGELIPGSRRMPLDTIGRETIDVPKNAEIITSNPVDCTARRVLKQPNA